MKSVAVLSLANQHLLKSSLGELSIAMNIEFFE